MDVVCFRLPGHSDAALRNMNSLREQRHFCDITIVAGGRQMFRGHKVVLAAGSAFLRDQFLLNPSAELQVSVLHSSTVIRELLQSCYTGILQFSAKEIVNYLTAASYLQMEHVVEKCRVALSQYLQSKSSSSGSVKTEEPQVMAAIVSGSTHSQDMSPPERASSLQPHSSEEEPRVSGVEHTGVQHKDEADLSIVRLRASEHSGGVEDEESRNDFSVFEVRIRDELHDADENAGVQEDAGDAGDMLAIRQVAHADDLNRDEGGAPGSSPRGGVRIWRRRFGEPRGGRGRGFKHRKRYTYRERRPSGNFQQAWRFPTSEEIMGSFGAGIGQEYLALGEAPMQVDYQPSECQGDVVGSDGGPGQFSIDGANAEENVGVVPLPTNEDGGEDSVAVVGSTSCVTGSVACEQCGLAFSSVEDLAAHSRSTHLLYVCPCCGKHFSQTSNLNRHMAVHRSAKLHSCPLCHKTFTQKSTLSDHMNMHSGQRPHVCAFCRICFAHKPALRRHLKEQHGKTTAQNYLEIQRESEEPAIGGGGGGGV